MKNINKLFMIATLILGMQNIYTQQPNTKTNITYTNFSSITTEIEKLIFTLSPQKHAQIEDQGLLEETEAMHTQFLSIVAKAKKFILAQSYTQDSTKNFEALVENILHIKQEEFDTINTTDLELCQSIITLLQMSLFFDPEDEFLLIFLSLLNNELENAVNSKKIKNDLYIDRDVTSTLLKDVKAITIALEAYGVACNFF